MDVAFFCGAVPLVPAGSTVNIAATGRQSFEDGIEALHSLIGATDHHAIAAINAPDTSAGADINIVDAFLL